MWPLTGKSRKVSKTETPRYNYEHLLARGKTKMQGLVAAMRKLLHAIFGILKHAQEFDGTKVYASAVETRPATANVEEVPCA